MNRIHHSSLYGVVNASTEIFLRQTDFQACNTAALQRSGKVRIIPISRCCIHVVMSANQTVQHCHILDGFADWPNLVERRCECNQTISGNAAIGRLQTNCSAERGRLPNRPARIRTQCDDGFACCNRSCRTAGRTARYTVQIVRIVGLFDVRGFCRRTHCKFIHVEFAGDNHLGCPNRLHHGCIKRRNIVCQHLGCTRCP